MTEKAKLDWKQLDITTGRAEHMDGQRLIKIFEADMPEDLAEQKAFAAELLGTGDLVAVQSVELWTKCPETGEADTLVAREHFYADLPKEQSDLVKAQVLAEELSVQALVDIFR